MNLWNKLKNAPYKMFLLLFYVFYSIDSINYIEISYRSLVYFLIFSSVSFIFVLLSYIILLKILKNEYKANVAVFIFSIFALFFKNFEKFLNKETIISSYVSSLSNFSIEKTSILIILSLLFISIGILIFIKRRLRRLNIFLEFYLSVLIIFKVAQVANDYFEKVESDSFQKRITQNEINFKPNIYFILLDSYSNDESLKKYFSFNNGSFLDSLKKRNFNVTTKNRSNYNWTLNSLASILNMNYLENKKNSNSFYTSKKLNLIKNNKVTTYLSNYGYKLINYSFFYISNNSKYATMYFWNSEYPFFQSTVFYPILRFLNIFSNFWYEIPYYNLRVIDSLNRVKLGESPSFIYAHLLLPHAPFNMDEDGKIISNEKVTDPPQNGYIRQIKGLNKYLIKIADSIIKRDNRAVIIFIGDHGSRLLKGEEFFTESFDNFLAYYNLNPIDNEYSISPVNLFRVLFNQYFNGNYRILLHKEINSLDSIE